MTLAFYPDAMAALANMDISRARDQIIPIDAVFSGPLLTLCKSILQPANASITVEERFRRIEDGLEPLWKRARPPGHTFSHMIADWSRALTMRAATSGIGRGIRQIERRIRSWAGQSQRDIQSNARAEQVFAMHMATRDEPGMTLAQLAVETGFADQSHMTRRVRRETGFTPEQLRYLIEHDEAFWAYRLSAGRF
jgi:AraC-like DNA-binding protein